MPCSDKDRLAAEFEEHWINFQMALSDKRKYPVQQFRAAWEIGRQYAEMSKRSVNTVFHSQVNPVIFEGWELRGTRTS